ncbi:MAG: MFS transporter [Gammaproteobacteria bacterium]|nr:MFS transporter [Gammaproteobacteria bacterium]
METSNELLLNLPIMLLGAVWGVLFLTQQQHLTTQRASYVTSMIFFGTIIGAPVVGWLSDCLGRRKLPMILFAILSILVVLTIMYLPHLSFSMLIVLFFLLGFVTSAQILTYPAIAESNDSSQGGAALGVASSIIMGGAGFFQPPFGRLMDLGWDGKLVNGIA